MCNRNRCRCRLPHVHVEGRQLFNSWWLEVFLEMKIKELPKEIRPREKALHFGVESLSDEELLALLIGSGVKGCSAIEIARNLLNSYLTLVSLANTNISSLEEHFGLSKITALKLLATFEFHNRLNSPSYQHSYIIKNSEDIYVRYRYLENYTQEVLAIVMLNRENKIIKEKMLYKGTDSDISVNPKEIYAELIISKCKNCVLIHNHPDGNLNPSDDDIYTTQVINNTCKTLQIKVLDHLIIYPGGYYSFKRNKLLS